MVQGASKCEASPKPSREESPKTCAKSFQDQFNDKTVHALANHYVDGPCRPRNMCMGKHKKDWCMLKDEAEPEDLVAKEVRDPLFGLTRNYLLRHTNNVAYEAAKAEWLASQGLWSTSRGGRPRPFARNSAWSSLKKKKKKLSRVKNRLRFREVATRWHPAQLGGFSSSPEHSIYETTTLCRVAHKDPATLY